MLSTTTTSMSERKHMSTQTKSESEQKREGLLAIGPERYKQIFESVPLSMWEEEYTEVIQDVRAIKESGVDDVRAYLEAHPEVVADIASKAIILDVNQEAIRLYEADSKEHLLGSIARTFLPETYPFYLDSLVAVANGEAHFSGETRVQTLKGNIINILLSYLTMTQPDGSERVLLCIVDITHRKQIEEELTRSNRELEEFAYVASHDLQEPLRTINSYAKLLERRNGKDLDSKANGYLQKITDGAQRMQTLINDLLMLSRLGQAPRVFEPVACAQIVEEVLDSTRGSITKAGAQVTYDNLPTILGDHSQLRLVFQNLIGNGLKFRGSETPHIQIAAQRDNDRWVISVRDNGIGIDDDNKEVIFAMFQRVHGRGEYPGTGIGLAIVKKIVERHDGRIWVESEVGKGSNFCFTLRAAGMAEIAA